jgi:hypothetical protein
VVEPEEPEAGTSLRIRWAETNYGRDSDSHVTSIGVFDAGGSQPFAFDQWVGPLVKGGEVELEVQVEELAEGTYAIRILHNKDGVDPDNAAFATRDRGVRTFTERSITVTSGGPAPTAPDDTGARARPGYLEDVGDETSDWGIDEPAAAAPQAFHLPTEVDEEGYLT